MSIVFEADLIPHKGKIGPGLQLIIEELNSEKFNKIPEQDLDPLMGWKWAKFFAGWIRDNVKDEEG